jgi:transcriptional regulator with XRE-family HTH domain
MRSRVKVKPRLAWIELEEKEKGQAISRQKLADTLGVSKQMISNYFLGKSYPPADKLFILAKALGRKVDELYVIEEEEKEK